MEKKGARSPKKRRVIKVFDTRLVTRNGKQYYRAAHNNMQVHSNTSGQFRHRATFANCINLWKCFTNSAKPSFDERPKGTNAYNRFMGTNLPLCHSFLTKEVLDAGGCVAHELVLSTGSLAPITLTPVNNLYHSNIKVGNLMITPATPRGEISRAIIENNDDFKPNDIITLFILTESQSIKKKLTIPTVDLHKVELRLDLEATDGQWDSLFITREGCECLMFACDTAGRCLVHSRTEGETPLASPAALQFGARPESYYESLTPEAFDRSAASYGGLTE